MTWQIISLVLTSSIKDVSHVAGHEGSAAQDLSVWQDCHYVEYYCTYGISASVSSLERPVTMGDPGSNNRLTTTDDD